MSEKWMSVLITGPEENLMAFQFDAMFAIELFDRQKQTVRCRVHGIDFMDLSNPNWGQEPVPEEIQKRLDGLLELAKRHDVSVQQLLPGKAEWPVLYLASHKMLWPDYLPGRRKKRRAG